MTGRPNRTPADDLLLVEGHVLERQLRSEITAGDHDRVGGSNYLIEVVDGLGRLDLCDQHRVGVPDGVAHRGDVLGSPDERDGELLNILGRQRRDAIEIRRSRYRHLELARRHGHSGSPHEPASGADDGDDVFASTTDDRERYAAVAKRDQVALLETRHGLVGPNADPRRRTRRSRRSGCEDHLGAGPHHSAPWRKRRATDLRAGQVRQNPDMGRSPADPSH